MRARFWRGRVVHDELSRPLAKPVEERRAAAVRHDRIRRVDRARDRPATESSRKRGSELGAVGREHRLDASRPDEDAAWSPRRDELHAVPGRLQRRDRRPKQQQVPERARAQQENVHRARLMRSRECA